MSRQRQGVITHCPWCGREAAGNVSDYYHEKDCHRRDVLRRMESAEASEMLALDRELAEASYTGD